MNKKVVLLSGGIDSSTCLGLAVNAFGSENVHALCLVYGQKHSKEVESAKSVADYYKVPLVIEHIDCFKFSSCSLLEGREDVRKESYADQIEKYGSVDTYVPFRNGILLSIAAAYAYSIGADTIFYGAHADDAAGNAYPDCTLKFVENIASAIMAGTDNKVTCVAPFISSTKSDIVRRGLELGVPYELTWSCYEGGDKPCGKCGTCIDRLKAFELNNAKDPLEYEEV